MECTVGTLYKKPWQSCQSASWVQWKGHSSWEGMQSVTRVNVLLLLLLLLLIILLVELLLPLILLLFLLIITLIVYISAW